MPVSLKLKECYCYVLYFYAQDNSQGQPKIPKSYALELITIRVWEENGRRESFPLDRMLKLVLQKLTNPSNINAAWTTYYSEEAISCYSGETKVYGKFVICAIL